MSDSRNNRGLFFLGLAVGAVAGYLLNSDKGRAIQKEASVKAKEYGTQIKETSQQQVEQLSGNVNKWIEQGQSYAADLQTMAKSRIDTLSSGVKETVEDTESSFQRGTKKAKAIIASQKKHLKNTLENGAV